MLSLFWHIMIETIQHRRSLITPQREVSEGTSSQASEGRGLWGAVPSLDRAFNNCRLTDSAGSMHRGGAGGAMHWVIGGRAEG